MNCKCNGDNCECSKTINTQPQSWSDQIYTDTDLIWDESGHLIGSAGKTNFDFSSVLGEFNDISYKYAENKILAELKSHLDKTYTEHYATEEKSIECFDAWIALGNSTPTFRNTAIKYLWRYGKKNGNNKQDLMKALHYIFMCLYVDHFKDEK